MRVLIVVAAALCSSSAFAHFKITSPDGGIREWIVTNSTGDPQKQSPCGESSGTQTGFVKTVTAGSKLTLNWIETVPHGGHYRIAIAPDRAQLVDPAPLIQSNDCISLAIQDPPVAPAIADGLFVHDNAAVNMPYQYDVTIPNTLGANTLQIIQFMRPHTPSCFYYHCINLNIVAATDAGMPDAGGTGGGAGGGAGGSAGGGSAGGGSAGGGSAGGGSAGGSGGAGATDGGLGGGAGGGATTPGGCGCLAGPGAGALVLLAFVLRVHARRRRST